MFRRALATVTGGSVDDGRVAPLPACLLLCGRHRRVPGTAGGWIYLADGIQGFDNSGIDIAATVAADPAGDIIAAGLDAGPSFFGGDVAIVKLNGSDGTEVWRTALGRGNSWVQGATDASGAFFVAASIEIPGTPILSDTQMRVAKLDGATGAVIWQVDVLPPGPPVPGDGGQVEAKDLVLDAAGDVLVGATASIPGTSPPVAKFTVIKFSGATGAELWRNESLAGSVQDLALRGSDVVAVGTTTGISPSLPIVARLAGGTGALVWQHSNTLLSLRADSVAVDVSGDVVFVADDYIQTLQSVVRKVSGDGGVTLWTYTPPAGYQAFRLAAGPTGDIIVAGYAEPASINTRIPFVLELTGGAGGLIWLTTLVGHATDNGTIALALDSAGSPFLATGVFTNPPPAKDIRVWKLDLAGSVLWTNPYTGVPTGVINNPFDLIIAPDGDFVIGGRLGGGGDLDFAVIKADAVSGACFGFGCLETLNLTGINVREKVQKRWSLNVAAKGNPLLAPPPPLTADDPSTAGAVLELTNPTTNERAVFVLPPGANWTRLGKASAPGSKGYLYRDSEGRSGPCKLLKMVPGKLLKVTCLADVSLTPAPFSLDEATQGELRVRLQMGEFEYCMSSAGGELLQDRGTAPGGPAGLFKVKSAPAPMSCP